MSRDEFVNFIEVVEKVVVESTNEQLGISSLAFEPQPLEEYLSRGSDSKDDFNLKEFLLLFPNKLHSHLWDVIHANMKLIKDRNTFELEIENGLYKNELRFVECVTTICNEYLRAYSKKRESLGLMLNTLGILHEMLFAIGTLEGGKSLQVRVSAILEKLFELFPEDDQMNELIPNTIVYILSESLLIDAKRATVKRAYAMRKALSLLDCSEPSTLQDLLLRTVISPLYLSGSDKSGLKFIVYAMNADPNMPQLLHSAIIPQIPVVLNDRMLRAYGDIYYLSWKKATGQTLMKIENLCVQDLMFHAIHARDAKLFSHLRTILNAFHTEKSQNNVDEMLLRLYEPILFRCLKVANPVVRRNALCLFIDAFPLRNPQVSRVDSHNFFSQQIQYINDLLFDECPDVRVIAVEGICRILTIYWESISNEDAFAFLKSLVSKLAYDANSIQVRIAVCKGLAFLLDNHLSHNSLKKLLPKLDRLIYDKSTLVRSSLVSLLMRVKSVRSISFDSIVSVGCLLDRLCSDSDQVKKQISSLLLNSYFPYNKTSSEILERILSLVEEHPDAAKEFYRCVLDAVPYSAPAKLIKTINAFIKKCVHSLRPANRESTESSRELRRYKELAQDLEFMGFVIEILANTFDHVLGSLKDIHDKDAHKEQQDFLRKEFAGEHLQDIHTLFPSLHISACVWNIARNLPQDHMSILAQDALLKLEKMCMDGSLRTDYQYIVNCVADWELSDKLLNIIQRYVNYNSIVTRSGKQSNSDNSKRRKTNEEAVPDKLRIRQSTTALALLNCVLDVQKSLKYLLLKAKKQLKWITETMINLITNDMKNYLETLPDSNDKEIFEIYMSSLFHTYLKLMTHKLLKSTTTTKFNKKMKRSQQVKHLNNLFTETPDEVNTILALLINQFIPIQTSGDTSLPDNMQLVVKSHQKTRTLNIIYYPLFTCLFKSVCIYLNEWIMLGICKLDGNDETIIQLLHHFFDCITSDEYQLLLPHLIPEVLKTICLVQKENFEFAIDLLNEILFKYPRLFISEQCDPLFPIDHDEATDEMQIVNSEDYKIPKSVQVKIGRVVNHRRSYIHTILISQSDNKEYIGYLAKAMLHNCFNCIQSDELHSKTYIDLCLSLLHEITCLNTLSKSNRKLKGNCITTFAAELCSWLSNTCSSLEGEETEPIEEVLDLLIDLCCIVLMKFEQFFAAKQQVIMQRLLAKTKKEMNETLLTAGRKCTKDQTVDKINRLLTICS